MKEFLTTFCDGMKFEGTSVFIGIDNGSTGSIGIQVYNRKGMPVADWFGLPDIVKEQDFTKKKQNITRLELRKMWSQLRVFRRAENVYVAMERPYTNATAGARTMALCRAFHMQYLDLLEWLSFGEPRIIDSGQWQKKFLPAGTKGPALKTISAQRGCKLWPRWKSVIEKHKDADGMFIAEWLRKEVTV